MKENNEKEKVKVITFSKKQILQFKRFKKRKDLLEVLLLDDKEYTIVEVDNALNKFFNKGGK